SLEQLGMIDRNFGWTVEMQIKAARQGLRYCEVPVSYRRRIGASKISGTIGGTIKAGYKILYLIGKYGLASARPVAPACSGRRTPVAYDPGSPVRIREVV